MMRLVSPWLVAKTVFRILRKWDVDEEMLGELENEPES